MHENLEEIVADMLQKIQEQVPEYRAIYDPATRADIRRAVERIALISFGVLAESRRLAPEEARAVKVIGAKRSRQGLPLEALLSALRIGLKVGSDWAIEYATKLAATVDDARHILTNMSRDLVDLQVDVITAAVAGHTESQGNGASGQGRRTQSFQEVLADPNSPAEELAYQAATLGCDLRLAQRLIVLADDKENMRGPRRASEAFCKAVPTAVEVLMADASTSHVALILADATWERASRVVHDLARAHPVVALVTCALTGARQFHREYQESRDMLRLAVKLHGLRRAVEVDDLLVHWFLESPVERKERFLEKTIGPVLKEANAGLLMKVLDALLGEETQAAAARRLGIGERSFRRHQKRLKELTGLDVHDPNDHFRLKLALTTWESGETGHQLAGIRS